VPATIRIKQPLWGASRVFHWKEKQPGWGIATDKLSKASQQGETHVTLEIQGMGYTVPIPKLKDKLKEKKSFNQNGNHWCGYLPLTAIQELAVSDAQPDKTGESGD